MQFLDFGALEHNVEYFKGLLGETKLCAVLKNDAYGHGAVHIAGRLSGIVDFFAVGNVDEAKILRYTKKEILILLPQDYASAGESICNDFILTLDSFETLNTIRKASCKIGKKARIHIKLDSGMSRLGFSPNDMAELLGELYRCDEISVEGVYSHFYGENIIDCDKQFADFFTRATQIENALNARLIKHIANSSGALISDKYRLDMVRIGLGLYGYGSENLLPVKTVTARVAAVKNIAEGSAVGYGAKYVAPRNMRVSVIDVGYANGFNQALVGAKICVNGVMCEVVAVCMAMIIVDTSNADVKVGDSATLLGRGVNIANDYVSVYELLCNLK